MKSVAKSQEPIEMVMFDLGRVLVDFDFKKVIRGLEQRTHLTHAEIRNYFKTTPLWDAFERGTVSPQQFFRQLEKDLHLKGFTFKTFKPLWNDIFTEMHETVEIAKRLKGKYRLAIISNVNRLHWEHVIDHHDFVKLFDHPIASYAVGHRKPELEIFHLTLRKAKIPASRAIFIDDLHSHVQAARTIGIRAHQFTGAKKLISDLKGVLE